MRNLARAIWFRREACAWLVLIGALITVQTQTYGEFVPGPPPPRMDGGAFVPSWPPETHRPITTVPPSSGAPSSSVPGQTGTTAPPAPGSPGRGTGPVPPPGLVSPTTTTLPPVTTAPPTTLATTTTKLCNRPGQPSQSTLRNGKPVVTREVDSRVVCTPA
jgi:hypothetical protein